MPTDNTFAVQSSNIARIGFKEHDQEQNTVTVIVVFIAGDARWEYKKVPMDIWREFMEADSIGSYFAKNIKGKFESVKV